MAIQPARAVPACVRSFGLALATALVLALSGCGGGSGGGQAQAQAQPAKAAGENARPAPTPAPVPSRQPAPAPARTERPGSTTLAPAPAKGTGARITFSQVVHDFGTISDTRAYQASFPFRNSGTGTLLIESVKAGCGCTVPTLAKYSYAPGEEGKIDIEFTPKGMSGDKPKAVTVTSNSQPDGVVNLQIAASIQPLLALETRFLKLGEMKLGAGHRQRLNLYYKDPELQFTRLEVTVPYITAHIVEEKIPHTDGYKAVAEVVVSPDAPWGSLYSVQLLVYVLGRIEMELAPIEHDYELFVQGSIFGDIQATASMRGRNDSVSSSIPFGALIPGAAFEKSVRLTRRSGQPFTVTAARIVDPPAGLTMAVRYEPAGANAWDVYVSGNTGTFTGNMEAAVEVGTDVPGEESLTVRVMGRVTDPNSPGG